MNKMTTSIKRTSFAKLLVKKTKRKYRSEIHRVIGTNWHYTINTKDNKKYVSQGFSNSFTNVKKE